jgi:hypothetical protein
VEAWKRAGVVRTVWFTREFKAFTGGHLKVWDYYNHVASSGTHQPRVHFGEKNVWEGNPWIHLRDKANPALAPQAGDILFLAGYDWLSLSKEQRLKPPVPVINLIQHLRHANHRNPRSEFLRFPATRICVSSEVEQALRDTRRTNGDLLTIPNAIDLSALPDAPRWLERPVDVCIAAFKNPILGREIAADLGSGVQTQVMVDLLPRDAFLEQMARARIVVCLPHAKEGFFLPALEAMALGGLVICPDCGGNRSFCLPQTNCYRPERSKEAIVSAIREALALDPAQSQRLLKAASQTAEQHSLRYERDRFHDLLKTFA